MPTVIAVKKMANPARPELGSIRPLILEEDANHLPQIVKPGDFPKNDEIFVIGDYQFVDDFLYDEPFCINFRQNDREVDYHDERWSDYVCHGNDVRELARDEYFHVIDAASVPDPSNPIISLSFRPNRLLMLRSISSNALYGPFDYEEQSNDDALIRLRLKACNNLIGFVGHDQHNVYEFSNSGFESILIGIQEVLLANLRDLATTDRVAIDFISNEALLKLGDDALPEKERAQKSAIKLYRRALASLAGTPSDFDSKRRTRLLSIVDRLDSWAEGSSLLIVDFLKGEAGQEKINNYLNNNQQMVLAAAQEHFNGELETRKKTLGDAIDALVLKKGELEQENAKTQAQVTSERQGQLTQDLLRKQTEIEAKGQELKALLERLSIASNVDDLKLEQEICKRDLIQKKETLTELQEQVSLLKETSQSIQHELTKSHSSLRERMQELKPLIDVLNGVLPSETNSFSPTPMVSKRRDDQPATGAELVNEVCKSLNSQGRPFRFHEVANFLISIHQSFLTVFAGLPGVGKTSLATYLSEALGMGERLLYIPIARGMTSQRDILGFYNPLTQRYQPAPTGLYNMLRQQDEEARIFPSWVLLDEANLSPIEHYFSSFLPMCDPDNKSREIKTGDLSKQSILVVPDTVRFLATINYDDTTEPLSSRLIDRVPIIRIEPPDGEDGAVASPPVVPTGTLSQGEMNRLLTPDGQAELTDDEEAVFTRITSVLRATHESNQGLPVIISPRKRYAVRRFCWAARLLMQQDGPAMRALDYAVAQHILPLLNGNGEQYLNRLTALQSAVQPLDLSKTQLKRIVEVGNNEHKFYRYFC